MLSVKHSDAEEEQEEHEANAVCKGGPGELTGTESAVFEGLDECRHGIELHDGMQRRVSDITQRIDYRRGVHP